MNRSEELLYSKQEQISMNIIIFILKVMDIKIELQFLHIE